MDPRSPREPSAPTHTDHTIEPGAEPAEHDSADESTIEDFDPEHVLALAQAAHHEAAGERETKTASERAFTGHNFSGFGADFMPHSYEPGSGIDHGKLDPKVRALGAQHVRILVPGAVVTTGMRGNAGPGTDHRQETVTSLEAQIAAAPNDQSLKDRLEKAKQIQAHDYAIVDSFERTLELAGKHATINLTFAGGSNDNSLIPKFAGIAGYLVTKGYHLQLTLENEPSNSDKAGAHGFRGEWNDAIRHGDAAAQKAALGKYVHAYELLDADLHATQAGDVRGAVKIVGGDVRSTHRKLFIKTVHDLGLDKFIDAYSFHIYWGAQNNFAGALTTLKQIRAMMHHLSPGKELQITEFGKERFRSGKERGPAPKPGEVGADGKPKHQLPSVVAVEAGVVPAFQQGLFALSAVNEGFSGVVKWDAFYEKSGGELGNPGAFSMIGGPRHGYHADATYHLLRLFTHATEAGWKVSGTNHGVGGAETHFRSEDGKGGAILAMSEGGKSVSTKGLPHGGKLHVAVWNADGKGGVHVRAIDHGDHVEIPANGAVAISTKHLA